MSEYKYPYISDKKMYAAVRGACNYIRETGWFNKATQYYADKYGLDVDRVKEEVRKRQAAGQQGRKRMPYKWFVVEVKKYVRDDCWDNPEYYVAKATTPSNAATKFCTIPDDECAPYFVAKAVYEGKDKKDCEIWRMRETGKERAKERERLGDKFISREYVGIGQCEMCGGQYVLDRVINRAGIPYSLIVCDGCECELFNHETTKEVGLLEYARKMLGTMRGSHK
jgi:hypothetical protein